MSSCFSLNIWLDHSRLLIFECSLLLIVFTDIFHVSLLFRCPQIPFIFPPPRSIKFWNEEPLVVQLIKIAFQNISVRIILDKLVCHCWGIAFTPKLLAISSKLLLLIIQEICQKKICDRSYLCQKIMPKKAYFATFANLQQKCRNGASNYAESA